MLTNDEINLICIYKTDSREDLIQELTQMRDYLDSADGDLMILTDSTLNKLRKMSDAEYATLDLFPDFNDVG